MTLEPAEIIGRLAPVYGMPVLTPHGDPASELVLTVLSQNTADVNSGRAFNQLRQAFPDWEAIADATVDEVIGAIRIGGLAQQKAPRIQAILRAIRDEGNGWDLDHLRTMPVDESKRWLTALPGVGPKTAACVLLFALGRPAMPVDTHVERVSKRLGLIDAKVSANAAHTELEALVPEEDYFAFHMLLIKHGRRTCGARRPRCGACPLLPDCPAGRRFEAADAG